MKMKNKDNKARHMKPGEYNPLLTKRTLKSKGILFSEKPKFVELQEKFSMQVMFSPPLFPQKSVLLVIAVFYS